MKSFELNDYQKNHLLHAKDKAQTLLEPYKEKRYKTPVSLLSLCNITGISREILKHVLGEDKSEDRLIKLLSQYGINLDTYNIKYFDKDHANMMNKGYFICCLPQILEEIYIKKIGEKVLYRNDFRNYSNTVDNALRKHLLDGYGSLYNKKDPQCVQRFLLENGIDHTEFGFEHQILRRKGKQELYRLLEYSSQNIPELISKIKFQDFMVKTRGECPRYYCTENQLRSLFGRTDQIKNGKKYEIVRSEIIHNLNKHFIYIVPKEEYTFIKHYNSLISFKERIEGMPIRSPVDLMNYDINLYTYLLDMYNSNRNNILQGNHNGRNITKGVFGRNDIQKFTKQ